MPLAGSLLLLSYVWMATLMFGACVPLLFPLAAVLAKVHTDLAGAQPRKGQTGRYSPNQNCYGTGFIF
eukprot:1733975-Amphidinium_carterae.1